MLPRIRLVVSRQAIRRIAWMVSLVLAVAIGFGLARYEPVEREARAPIEPVPIAKAEPPPAAPDRDGGTMAPLVAVTPGSAPEPMPKLEPPPAPRPEPKPRPPRPVLQEPVPEPLELEPLAVPVAPIVVATPVAPAPDALARARRIDQLAEQGSTDEAREAAESLLTELPSTAELTAAFVAAGADKARADLNALRVLQVAGHTELSEDLARELKRSYASTPEVAKSIRRWTLLIPRIVTVESSIDSDELVVTGTLENPDVGDVRKARVLVEALDAGGNLLARTEARVRPRVLAPGGRGDFEARFKKLDPRTVLRTRATIVEWESEVLKAG